MDLVRGTPSLLAVTAGWLLALRVLHVVIPAVQPAVLTGPVYLTDPRDVRRYVDLPIQMPYFRPMSLGEHPVEIVAERYPYPRATIRWRGVQFLDLSERRGGPMPATASDAAPFEPIAGALTWEADGAKHLVARIDELWIEIRTDLSHSELRRLVETLMPLDEMR